MKYLSPIKYLTIFFFLFLNNKVFSQFLEPGIGFGVLSYSGDLKRGYSLSSSSMCLEVFQRLNLSQHISVKGGIKRGSIKGNEKILDALSKRRGYSFKSKLTEFSTKIEYNFLDYFDETGKKIFTPYLFFGIGANMLKNVEKNNIKVSGKNELNLILPFGLGFKYLYKNRFSFALEFEIKNTLTDQIDALENNETLVKNFQYGNPKNNDFYYFTGFKISYILYTIPCPQNSAPSNNIY